MSNGITILMPTYNQGHFIRRAFLSLQRQTFEKWELIIINDGCIDDTELFITDILANPKVTYLKNNRNEGLGFSLNRGLEKARYDKIAYLPSDDYYHKDHLMSLKEQLDSSEDIILAFSGVIYAQNDSLEKQDETASLTIPSEYTLQLVQVCHRKTNDRWVERSEFITDDLFLMYWNKLVKKGVIKGTFKKTCFWTSHPEQRHKIISERFNGHLNKYRTYYKIKAPLKIRIHKNKFVDEEKLYAQFRKKHSANERTLKILLVGELSYNPERIYALEEYGHQLYAIWLDKPAYAFHNVGKLPFGNVKDISKFDNDWLEQVKKINPDIIYGLSNLHGIAFMQETITTIKTVLPNIPLVIHFKEGPFTAIKYGRWGDLLKLHRISDGNIYLSSLGRQWFRQFLQTESNDLIMDMDLPKKDYFTHNFQKKLSEEDGAVHTFVAGRLIGLKEKDVRLLTDNNIHIHIYSESYHSSREPMYRFYKSIAPNHIHMHPHCSSDRWVEEFSQYDAGWLHLFESLNEGDLFQASWDDLNLPSRLSVYAASSVPMILKNNDKHLVAVQELLKSFDIGIFINDINDLAIQLKDRVRMEQLKMNMMKCRDQFTFDYYVPKLTSYFRQIIQTKKSTL